MGMFKYLIILSFIFLFYSCDQKSAIQNKVNTDFLPHPVLDESKSVSRIAMGSCSRPDYAQPLWSPILANDPDVWIWLGDIVYGDTEKMDVLRRKYQLQDDIKGYQALKNKVPVIGIWDDHDYGVNDGGKEYPMRAESRDVLFDFLKVPKSNPAWERAGAYQSYTVGEKGKQTKIILLDARYFRDQVIRKHGQNPQYLPNEQGTILGEAQWKWLEEELANSEADVHIIASGIQVLPTQHNYEKWNTFAHERQRLFDLIVKNQIPGVVFISGDRHIGEISKMDVPGLNYPLIELTTSGLTHTFEGASEPNDKRIGKLTDQLNFGLIEINWDNPKPQIKFSVKGVDNKELIVYQPRK